MLEFTRIDLSKTNYPRTTINWKWLRGRDIDIDKLNEIYIKYCRYKEFKSVQPIFDSEYESEDTDVIGYYDNDNLVAFSLIHIFNESNVEALQFAWDYENPNLRLGIESLKHECHLYKKLGFEYIYLGASDEYKKSIDGFEILGPL